MFIINGMILTATTVTALAHATKEDLLLDPAVTKTKITSVKFW